MKSALIVAIALAATTSLSGCTFSLGGDDNNTTDPNVAPPEDYNGTGQPIPPAGDDDARDGDNMDAGGDNSTDDGSGDDDNTTVPFDTHTINGTVWGDSDCTDVADGDNVTGGQTHDLPTGAAGQNYTVAYNMSNADPIPLMATPAGCAYFALSDGTIISGSSEAGSSGIVPATAVKIRVFADGAPEDVSGGIGYEIVISD